MITWKTLSGALLATAAAWTVRSQWPTATNPSLSPSVARMQCVNPNCAKISSVQLRSAEDLICVHCSGRLAPLTQCSNCHDLLILSGDIGELGPAICPKCKEEVRRED